MVVAAGYDVTATELAELIDRIREVLEEETIDVDPALLGDAARAAVQLLIDEGALDEDA